MRQVQADPALAELVRRDVFNEATEDEQAQLRSPEMLERFRAELERVIQSIKAQIENDDKWGNPKGAEWHHSAGWLFKNYCDRIGEVNVLARDLRDKWRNGDVGALNGEITRLRGAIRSHQKDSTAAGVEPEEWDLRLWDYVPARRGR